MAVAIWHADLDVADAVFHTLEATLSRDERERADRFRFPHLRRRFISARGILRMILGARIGVAPDTLRFRYGERGKPELMVMDASPQLHFNVAHSESHGLFAVAADAVGVDVEVLRDVPDAEAIAERFFSAADRAALATIPAADRHAAFLRCWTRKEAYVKGLGLGLAQPLDEEPRTEWRLDDVSSLPVYAAAVAHCGAAAPRVEQWSAHAFG